MDASPPARTVLITAEILGLDIETREVNLLEKHQYNSKYLEKNPAHTIPLLEDGDFVLSDSHAIAVYLISKYGGAHADVLYPSDLKDRAIINQRLFFDASILFPRFIAVEKDIFYGTAVSIDEVNAAGAKEAYGFLEKYLERSPFVAGKNITIADIACVTTVATMDTMVPLDNKYPKIQAWINALSQEEWYQKLNQPGVIEFGMLFAKYLKKNAQ